MLKRKDDIRTFIVIVCVCVICVVIALVLNMKSNYDKLEHVNQYNVFFTNVNYLNNYISRIASNDSNAVYGMLYNKYIEDNGITIDNVLDSVGKYSILSSFNADDMYYVQIKDNFIYYIQGKVYESGYDEDKILIDNDFSIILISDINNLSYSLYPVDDNNYKNVVNSIKKINIENNGYNSIQDTNLISKEQVCVIYLNDFIDNIYSDIIGSYDLLSENMKKIYSSSNEYKDYIYDNIDLISSTGDKCKMEEIDEKRVYTVIDTNGNTYVFNENYVMDYTVDFYFKEIEEVFE